MSERITGVILAGGASKRFHGLIKAKIVIEGIPVISRIIEVFHDIFNEIIIVTNTPDEFSDYNNYRIIGDKFLSKGPLGGIHSAMTESVNETFFVVAGDMPLLEKELITRQIDFFRKNKCDILIPVVGDYIEPLHGIYRKSVLGALERYLCDDNDYSMRAFIKRCDVLFFPVDKSGKSYRAFTNINYPSDIDNVKRLLE